MYELKPFTEKDVWLAQAFAEKAKVYLHQPAFLHSTEKDNDTIVLGSFTIMRVEGAKTHTSILGESTEPCDEYVVDVEAPSYSSVWGHNVDVVEVVRCHTFYEALKACAHAELEWALDSMEFPELEEHGTFEVEL